MAAEEQQHQQQIQNNRAKFEQCHVQQVYNEIASSVNDLQQRAWPNVKRFLKKLDKGALVADIGCGNGRYLSINSNTYKVGVDVCKPLVDSSRSKGHEVAYADNLYLPFRSDMFDAVISIGVIHHFCSPDRRVTAIQELTRIMKPGGKLMLYVWAYEQKHRKFDSQDVLVPWHEGRKLRRTGSTASCQSSSGLSSTSSFSEDESSELEHSEAPSRDRTSTQGIYSRQSSVSLEDISTLSNFNSDYYALDFSPNSPARKKVLSDQTCGTKCKHENTSLVKECRKIEASLRALSAGILFEKKLRKFDSNPDLHNHDNKQDYEHNSLESLNNCNKDNPASVLQRSSHSSSTSSLNLRKSSQSGNIGSPKMSPLYLSSLKGSGSLTGSVSRVLSIDELSCKGSSGDRSPIDIYLDDDDDVFLISDDFPNTVSVPGSPLTKNILKKNMMANTEPVNQMFDEVDVRFKPDRTDTVKTLKNKEKQNESKSNGKSVFGLLKSKVLQIFNIDDNGAKSSSLSHSASMPLNTSNHVKQMCMTPELPDDLICMAAKLNFAVREFPLSSCVTEQKDENVKYEIGTDGSGSQLKSPKDFRKNTPRQDSFEENTRSPRSRKKSDGGHLKKNVRPSNLERRQDRKLSLNHFQRTNSGNDLLKSAIRNRTIQQTSPTGEPNRSNPFVVRSFSCDYVEDPSTEYPFKNMKQSDDEAFILKSPKEILSVEQTLYDCFIKLDVDKINNGNGKANQRLSVNNGDIRERVGSELSDVLDEHWEYNEAGYDVEGANTMINQNTNNMNGVKSEFSGTLNGETENHKTANWCMPGYTENKGGCDKKTLNGSGTVCNGAVNGVNSRYSESGWDDGSSKRSQNTPSKRKSLKNTKKDNATDSMGMCSMNNESPYKQRKVCSLSENCDSTVVCSDEVPNVSCIDKAMEGSASTQLCRYYHVFREGELERLISSHVKDLQIVQCFYDHANWCLVAVKVDTDTHYV